MQKRQKRPFLKTPNQWRPFGGGQRRPPWTVPEMYDGRVLISVRMPRPLRDILLTHPLYPQRPDLGLSDLARSVPERFGLSNGVFDVVLNVRHPITKKTLNLLFIVRMPGKTVEFAGTTWGY